MNCFQIQQGPVFPMCHTPSLCSLSYLEGMLVLQIQPLWAPLHVPTKCSTQQHASSSYTAEEGLEAH